MKKVVIVAFYCMPSFALSQNVGVGIANPENKLHIVATDSNAVRIEKSTALDVGSSNGIYFKNGSYFTGAIKQIGASTAASRTGIFGWAAANTADLREYISITDGGNVGIGNTAPTQKLVVNGNTLISNHLLSNSLQSATSLQVGTTIQASGNINSSANIIAGGGLFAGNTSTNTNGGIRYNTVDDRMEIREQNTWKRIAKQAIFYQSPSVALSSAVRNSLVVHPGFEWIVPETGYYQVHLQTDMTPVFKTNGCNLQYLDNSGAVWVYSKTRNLQFFSSGAFKWFIVNGQTGCQSAQSIPLQPAQNKIIYLQQNEVMSLAFQFDMFTVPAGALDNWLGSGTVNFVKID